MSKLESARWTRGFTESVIREMTRLSLEHDGVNLSQGFPDFPAPDTVKDAACAAIRGDINQYAVTWGTPPMREAIARKFTRWYGVPVNPDTQVTVCCGSTEGSLGERFPRVARGAIAVALPLELTVPTVALLSYPPS